MGEPVGWLTPSPSPDPPLHRGENPPICGVTRSPRAPTSRIPLPALIFCLCPPSKARSPVNETTEQLVSRWQKTRLDSGPHLHSCPMAIFSPKSECLIFLHRMPEAWALATGVPGHTAQPECPSQPPWEGEEGPNQRQQRQWVGEWSVPLPGQGRGGRRERWPLGGSPMGSRL